MVIEIVDQRAKVEAFLPELDAMIPEGLVTLEPVQVILYRVREGGSRHTH
jgi:PII-like signaling protein